MGLHGGKVQPQAGRAAIHHAAHGGAVAFAEGGHAQGLAEGVARHAGMLARMQIV